MSEEMMDHVNEHDEVVGTFPRSEIYSRKLRHRIAHVFLLDAQGRIALARRGKEISYCPDHWCSTAAGHVAAGESYEDEALREMQEQIGESFYGGTLFIEDMGEDTNSVVCFRVPAWQTHVHALIDLYNSGGDWQGYVKGFLERK